MSNKSLKHATYGMTLHVRDHCLCLHAQRAARAIARRFDDALRPLDLKSGQFSLLISLNRPEPPPISAVAEVLAMDRTTLTANIKPLERRGLLTVKPDPRDRRIRRLALTESGLALLEKAIPLWTRTEAEIEQGLARDADLLRKDLLDLAFGPTTAEGDGGSTP